MKKPVAKKPAKSSQGVPTRTDRLVQKEGEIAAKLRELRDRGQFKNKDVAAGIGRGVNAVKKMMSGGSVKAYAKLALLAELLNASPNEILGFNGGFERQRLLGVLEAILASQVGSLARARAIAQVVLETLSEPLEDNPDIGPRDIARIQTETVIRQALRGSDATKPGA